MSLDRAELCYMLQVDRPIQLADHGMCSPGVAHEGFNKDR